MKNLNNELLENLLSAELVFSETVNFKSTFFKSKAFRFCFWAGEELSQSSLRKNFAAVNMSAFESELKKLSKVGVCKLLLDDGWLHVSLLEQMFDNNQKLEVENSFEFEAL